MKKIAKSYALALFEVAEELFKEEEYKLSMEMVLKLFKENPDYLKMLSLPNISFSKKIDSLNVVFSDVLPKEILYFFYLMCKNGDVHKAELVAGEYIEIYEKSKNIKTVNVTTSENLSEKQIASLKKSLEKITNFKVVLSIKVDKSLIGGIKAEVDDKVFDGSLKRRFELLKEKVR